MKEWLSARELAGLPGMPGTVQGINKAAPKQAWVQRQRKGRGGGSEYRVRSLPDETQRALLNHSLNQMELPGVVEAEPPALPTKQAALLKDWQRSRMEARAAIIQEVERIGQVVGIHKAIHEIVSRAKNETLPEHLQRLVPQANARKGQGGDRTLSERTLHRWRAAMKSGVTSLAPKDVVREDFPGWAIPLLKLYQQPQKPALAECVSVLRGAGILPEGVTPPSYDQARRFLKKLGEVQRNKGRMFSRELKSLKPFVRRDTSSLLPGDIYTADGHTFDAEVAHPIHGRPFRPEVTLILDVATRLAVGWSVTLAESGLAVLDALRHATTQHGIPALFYVDNGGGYKNEMMTDTATGFMARLGIEMTNSLPYNSQARGIIERAHQTVFVRAAKYLPTYVGADMDPEARKLAFKRTRADGAGLIAWEAFCTLIDQTANTYNKRTHRGLPKLADPVTGRQRHQSPSEAWELAKSNGWEPHLPEDPDDLFRPQQRRTTRRGEVSLFGNLYFSDALAEWHGQEVFVGYDVWDASKVWVRDTDGVLVCTAHLDANKVDYFPKSRIDQAREQRAKGRLRRLENKRMEIEAEAGLEEDEIPTAPTPEDKEAARAVMARLEPTPVHQPVETSSGSPRPIFKGEYAERDWGLWVWNNLEQIDPAECAEFEERLESASFRLLIGYREDESKTAV